MKRTTVLSFGTMIGLGIMISTTAEAASNDLYRIYNPNTGEHFFTEYNDEKDWLVNQGWRYEEVAWVVPKEGEAVYRLYNPIVGDHFYTKSVAEYDGLATQGWLQEGRAFYSDVSKNVPVFRSYNKNAQAGAHMYTAAIAEHNGILNAGWKNEEVSFYAADPGNNSEVANKDELRAIIQNTEKVDPNDYTAASYQNLLTALTAAKKIESNEGSTQVSIDTAMEALQTALNNLAVGVVDKTALVAKISEAESYSQSEYTAETYEKLQIALTAAQKVADDAAAMQSQVNAQLMALEKAVTDLVPLAI